MTISLSLAKALKEAGLVWQADLHHFFAIPDRELDDRIFVVTDVMAYLELFRGWPVVTFHGSAEWALDYILTAEVVWMPTESELRQELEALLVDEETPFLQLNWQRQADPARRYGCRIYFQDEYLTFEGVTGSEAYGEALLYVLQQRFPAG